MKEKLYYTPPSDEIFNEAKKLAITIWQEILGNKEYLEEKLRIKYWANVYDNFMTIFAMFDSWRIKQLLQLASPELRKAFIERYVDGGGKATDFFINLYD